VFVDWGGDDGVDLALQGELDRRLDCVTCQPTGPYGASAIVTPLA
jgi:hypothetical protein